MAEEPWVDVERVADHLAVTRNIIYRWIKQKRFPSRHVGRSFRFTISEADRWVRAGTGSIDSRKKTPARK